MIVISLVPQEGIAKVWPIVEPMLAKAAEYTNGRYTTADILTDIATGQQTLWIAIEDGKIIGCTTVSIVLYPNGMKTLCYEYLGGEDVSRWLGEGHKVCMSYAKENGCTKLECLGRSGWKRFLGEIGYKQFAVKYEFNIED